MINTPRDHGPIHRLAVGLLVLTACGWAHAQGVDLADRPVARVSVQGLDQVPLQLVLNQVRVRPGDPYDPQVVRADIVRITHLGRFSSVRAQVEPLEGGRLGLVYVVVEQPVFTDVQVVGNKAIPDQELLGLVLLRAGDPIDSFLIDRATQQIKIAYEKAGFFVTDIKIDQDLLDESGILLFRVREGPRVRIRGIRFEGNTVFSDKQLYSKIKSRTYVFLFRKGELSREQLDNDADQIRGFCRDRGYLDAQVGRRIDLSPNQKDASVVFVVHEGRRYTVERLQLEGHRVFSRRQLVETIPLKVGDVFSADRMRRSRQALSDLYGRLGYLATHIQIERLFHKDRPRVDVLIRITEGQPSLVGHLMVRGNRLTQDKVIYRQVRGMTPGRRFDRVGLETTQRRLSESSLFNQAQITLLGDDQDRYRDVLIQVEEANSGTLSFGAGISSDAGLLGAIDLVQRNFDIADTPESFGEFITGRAFRGAGQSFALSLQPGNEQSRYSVSFREPAIFESDLFFDTNLFFFEREREDWDEERLGGAVGLGRRFGDVWSASVRVRQEEIRVSNLEPDAPLDAFAVEGDNVVTSLSLNVARNTTDSRVFPTEGHRLSMGISRTGVFGGDFGFTSLSTEFNAFWTVEEDFFGRRSVLSAHVEVGYIIENNEAPLFERLYAGGHRSFRGFALRGVGPRGVRADTLTPGEDPIGGRWLFLLGLEYNYPIYKDVVRGVFFTDTGTVQDDIGLDQYRVSIGAGIRIKIPILGQAPFALDLAIPVTSEPGDEEQVFSFDLALPF